MKIVIDIDEEIYNLRDYWSFGISLIVREAIRNGTPLPDNATNGDVIKALFPDAENIRMDNGLPLNFVLEFELHRNYKDWWNAPYKVGDKEL